MKSRPAVSLLVVVVALGGSTSGAPARGACAMEDAERLGPTVARTDHRASGNRVVESCGLRGGGTVVDVELGQTPAWVLPDPGAPGDAWLVALRDGAVVRLRVDTVGSTVVEPGIVARLEPGEPPIARLAADGTTDVSGALTEAQGFEDPIPDARVVSIGEGVQVVLSGPTDRYPHGALGDGLEASSVSVQDGDHEAPLFDVGLTAVIEGLSPLVADLDEDGDPELLVTVSDMYEGARLAAFDLDGNRIASSEPIGRGFRWLHQIGAGATGPAGEIEVIAVRTPHIGGSVEAYRLDAGRFERVATLAGFSSHELGSPNLDMALLADVDSDGQLDVVVPTQDMGTLAVLSRRGDDFVLLDELGLDGHLATNVGAAIDADGGLVLASGTDDGRLRIFR